MVKILSLLILLFSVQAQAFTLSVSNGAYFEKSSVKVNVDDSCSGLGLTNSELLSLAAEAVELFWNKVPTSRLHLEQGAVIDVDPAFSTAAICTSNDPCVPNPSMIHSNDILISCNSLLANFANTSVIALTVPNNVVGQNIVGATLLINNVLNNQFQDKSRAEQTAILAHEIGHAIGLGHSPVKDSLMYYQSISTRFRLGWDDIDGITYLYPTEQPFSGCGSVDLNQSPPNQMGPLIFGFLSAMLLGLAFRRKLFY